MQRHFLVIGLRASCIFLMLFIALVLTSCGRPVGTLSGKVTYKGSALKGGNVVFEGERTYSTPINEDGTYTSPQMQGGDYKVCVDNSNLRPRNSGYSDNKAAAAKNQAETPKVDADANIPEGYTPSNPKNAAVAKDPSRYTAIPSKYTKADQTPITCTVTGGSQPFDIDLK
jgi:hypothetical protein